MFQQTNLRLDLLFYFIYDTSVIETSEGMIVLGLAVGNR